MSQACIYNFLRMVRKYLTKSIPKEDRLVGWLVVGSQLKGAVHHDKGGPSGRHVTELVAVHPHSGTEKDATQNAFSLLIQSVVPALEMFLPHSQWAFPVLKCLIDTTRSGSPW